MYDSIISACKTMDVFGLAGAIGRFDRDRFIFANDSFLRITGLRSDQLPGLSVNEVVEFNSDPGHRNTVGPVEITVQPASQNMAISGFAAFADGGLVYMSVPPCTNRISEFSDGASIGRDQERQRLASYFHGQLAPDLTAVVLSIEAIRSQLQNENHPAEVELRQVRDRLSKMLRPIREKILGSI